MAEKKGFWTEFKEFISRGSVMDMAVGVVVGGNSFIDLTIRKTTNEMSKKLMTALIS